MTSGGHHWRPVQIYSLQDTPPPTGADNWWLLKHVWLVQASGTHPTGMFSCQTFVDVIPQTSKSA